MTTVKRYQALCILLALALALVLALKCGCAKLQKRQGLASPLSEHIALSIRDSEAVVFGRSTGTNSFGYNLYVGGESLDSVLSYWLKQIEGIVYDPYRNVVEGGGSSGGITRGAVYYMYGWKTQDGTVGNILVIISSTGLSEDRPYTVIIESMEWYPSGRQIDVTLEKLNMGAGSHLRH